MKKWWIVAAVVIVLVIAGLVVAFSHGKSGQKRSNNTGSQSSSNSTVEAGSGPNYQALSSCTGDPVFTALPTTLADYDQISPLGNIGVPDHTVPTDHLYFNFKHIGNNVTNPDLFAPGKIVVTSVVYSGEKINGVDSRSSDYNLVFTPCKGLSFNFGHVQTLTGAVNDAVKDQQWDRPCDTHTPAAGEETFYCTKTTDLLLQPGDLIGKVGGKPELGAFDFGAHDASYTDPGFISTKWYPTVNAVCGLNYFDTATKAQLMTLIKRTAEPRCGTIGQDKADTAQGTWFASSDPQTAFNNWNMHLSLVHSNFNPSIGVLAIGGTITDPSVINFTPVHTGVINREFSETATGTLYCYQNEAAAATAAFNSKPSQGKVLVQLLSNSMLKVEHQTGTCTTSDIFQSPVTYYR